MKRNPNYSYINEFAEKNYDRITLIVPKGSKESIKEAAKSAGKNVSEFITDMIPKSLIGAWKKKEA